MYAQVIILKKWLTSKNISWKAIVKKKNLLDFLSFQVLQM